MQDRELADTYAAARIEGDGEAAIPALAAILTRLGLPADGLLDDEQFASVREFVDANL